jgi:DNA-binding GntR family transcriptional regulator
MSAQITSRIREEILAGRYAPGSALLQDAIAADFGVSKIPVREALLQLRAEGLVNVFAHRGFQVSPLSAGEIEEVSQIRLRIEPEAVRAGAQVAGPADCAAAKGALAALNDALATNRLDEAGGLNCQFHLALIVPHAHPVAADILSRLHNLSRRYVRAHLSPAGRARRAAREHTAIFQAWQAGQSHEACRLTQAHIEETRQELNEALKSAP